MARDKLTAGMATVIWEQVTDKAVTTPPPAAMKAAKDLLTLYVEANGSVADIVATDGFDDGDWHLGIRLAINALGLPDRNAKLGRGISVPLFRVKLEGDELVWDGGWRLPERRQKRKNPTDFDPDDAKQYGRYAYRMGISAAKAVEDARAAGVPQRLLTQVAEGWGKEREDTVHGGFVDSDAVGNPSPKLFRDVSGGLGQKPHVKSVAETRAILARIKDRCSPACPGWSVFNEHEGRPEIQVCDECNSELPKAIRLSDDDVAQLPEAQKALREAVERSMEHNPRRKGGSRSSVTLDGEPLLIGDEVIVPADREHGVRGGRGTVVKLMPGQSWNVTVRTADDEYNMNAGRLRRA